MTQKGFTLIELLVVIAIISILLLVVVANFGYVRDQFALTRSASKFSQDARRAQTMASSTLSSYGIYLNKPSLGATHYILFTDTNNNHQYDEGQDTLVETITLEPGVFIKQISDNAALTTETVTTETKTLITTISTPNVGNPDRVDITLALESDPAQIKVITIQNSGLVTVQ